MIAAVPLVAASGFAEPMVCVRLTLPEPALELLEWRKTVLIDKTAVTPDKVILQGRLRTRCLFVSRDSGEVPPAPGTIAACGGLVAEAAGTVRMTVADFAFVTLVRAPGACPGMMASVVDAFVSGETSRPVALSQNGLITHVLDQSVLFVSVKVLAPVEINWPEPAPYRRCEHVWREVQPEVVIASEAERMPDETPAPAAEPVLDETTAQVADLVLAETWEPTAGPVPDGTIAFASEPVSDEATSHPAESMTDRRSAFAAEPVPAEATSDPAESKTDRTIAFAAEPVLAVTAARTEATVPDETTNRAVALVAVQNERVRRVAQTAEPTAQRQLKRPTCEFTWVNPLHAVPPPPSGTHTPRK